MIKFHAGFDIGTDSVSAVVLSKDPGQGDLRLIHAPKPLFHFGNPVYALRDIYEDIIEILGPEEMIFSSFTGSGGLRLAELLNVPYHHDTITIPAGAVYINPAVRYVFHMGAKDSYFFEIENIQTLKGRHVFVPDHSTGTKCGGGSGTLITKQCRRYFENDFPLNLANKDGRELRHYLNQRLCSIFQRGDDEIDKAERILDVGGRCGVVIQSDMIHLQNSGEKINNILAGLYLRTVKNFQSDVLKSRVIEPDATALACGGMFESPHFVSMAKQELGLEIFVPDHFRHVGAVGAVIKSDRNTASFQLKNLDRLNDSEKKSVKMVSALNKGLKKVVIYDEEEPVEIAGSLRIYTNDNNGTAQVILGIDGGSTTTKAVVVHKETHKILARICLYTNGKPLETIQTIFKNLNDALGSRIDIKAVAYTGSSGAFYHKLFTRNPNGSGAKTIDLVKDEITCHALGVKHYNAKTDTIFELGGQDAKFTLFNPDGTVRKSRMNLSCMAGTGQTMQNMVEMIGLDITSTFHDYALAAEQTPVVDDTCGVFTEAGVARLISLGFPKEEIAAAIAYGFMGGYVNTFIGNESFGDCASAQGGPFTGRAPLAALAMHTDMEIHAFPHRQLFGALGAALAVSQEMRTLETKRIPYECRFRGLEACLSTFVKSERTCGQEIQDSCGMKDCRLSIYNVGPEKIITGGACPKGNTDASGKRSPDYVDIYKRILGKHLASHCSDLYDPGSKERIMIPRALSFWNEKGVFYAAFYKHLGFDVVLSPESDDAITEMGLASAHSETCFPVKIAHGHAAFLKPLMRQGKDKLLLVSVIGEGKEKYKFCPYVSAAGFLVKDSLGMDNKDVLIPVIYFNDPSHPIDRAFHNDLLRVFGKRYSLKQIRKAISAARKAETLFCDEIHATGQSIVSRLIRKNEKIYIGLGRGYTLFDDKANSKVHELFVKNGLHYVPAFFLKQESYDIEQIAENMYWVQGRKIIRDNLSTAINPHFFPVRATNFNCGSDSMLLFQEERIIEKAGKPHLVLQTDGHSSNAQFGTRIHANHEVVKTYKPKPIVLQDFVNGSPPVILKNKIIGIPYMGDHSYVLAATFRALGFKSEVMPTQTSESRTFADKLGGANICQPFSFQVGDSLAWIHDLKSRGINPEKQAVIMEPMAKGPCRFGQYHVLLKKIIAESGFPELDILSPDAEKDYSNLPMKNSEIVSQAKDLFKGIFCMDILYDALLRTRPYEKVKGSALACYNELSKKLISHIESRADIKTLVGFMSHSKKRYESLLDPKIPRKPIIAVTGEIFMRLNPHANNNSIVMLEKYNLEMRLAPLSLWMEYTNRTSIQNFKMANSWKKYIMAIVKKRYMQNVTRVLFEPFGEYLKGREPHDSTHIIDHVQRDLVYDENIQGESPLSIGEAYMFASGKINDISGIYHIGPFGCMQEIAATSQIQSVTRRIRQSACSINEKIIPFMDAIFGDSELSNLDAEMAVFSEKCHVKHRLTNENAKEVK